jgi:DNA-binding transcriptional LysR family regulator
MASPFIDSKLLHCFLAVAEYGSVTLASRVLCLTQSATSKNILKLEDALGVPLFDRSSGGMTPTTFGLTLARHARLVISEMSSARSEIESLKRGGYGTLKIGSGPMWSVFLLPDAIRSLLQSRPGARIWSTSGVIDTLVPQLLKSEIDLICAALDFPDHSEIEKHHLFDVEYVVMARNEHPLHQKSSIGVEELLEYPWIGLTNDLVANRRFMQFFIAAGLKLPQADVEVSSLGSMLAIAQTGDFLFGAASPIAEHAHRLGLSRVRVDANFWLFQAGIACRRNHASPLVSEMIALLKDASTRYLATR